MAKKKWYLMAKKRNGIKWQNCHLTPDWKNNSDKIYSHPRNGHLWALWGPN